MCEYCKYDIIDSGFTGCLVCRHPTSGSDNLCGNCRRWFSRAWCVGERHDVLREIIDKYKFSRMRAAGALCGELLDRALPILPADTIVTYITTTPRDIRRRGYDHARLIAMAFAKRRGLKVEKTIDRISNHRQFGASKKQRIENAAKSIAVYKHLSPAPYLLIDDIYTTGATMNWASEQLLRGGASEVYIAVVARQPLEKDSSI